MEHKKIDIDALVGYTISSFKEGEILTKEGKTFYVILSDDGDGGNDSYAFFKKFDLSQIIDRKVVKAWEESNPDEDGAFLKIETPNGTAIIEIIHESNGYYGWSYEIVIKNTN